MHGLINDDVGHKVEAEPEGRLSQDFDIELLIIISQLWSSRSFHFERAIDVTSGCTPRSARSRIMGYVSSTT